jgi:aryl-phospho-beta-D-glucosidase BglC (GH1 family)
VDEPTSAIPTRDAAGADADARADVEASLPDAAVDAAPDTAPLDAPWEQTLTADGSPIAPGGYHVVGNQVFDAQGRLHIFRGVDRPSLEWQATGVEISLADFQHMAQWKSNVVRIAVSQDFWLEGAAQYVPFYQDTVDAAIQWGKEAGMDVIVDLHWSDAGNLQELSPGQRPMADKNSITFWQQVATRYRGDGRVMFELYNEPHDVSWDVWQNGGEATLDARAGTTFEAVGMQQMYDAVRATGADNLVWIGGLSWAYDLSEVPQHLIQGYNIGYVSHIYQSATRDPPDWAKYIDVTAKIAPVMVNEFGNSDCSRWFYAQVLDYAKKNQLSWSAWAWYVGGCTFPSVIADWNGTPNWVGQVVKDALESY